MKDLYYILTIFIFTFTGCKNDVGQNQKPTVEINHLVDGLKVTLTGSVFDADGTITDVSIDWGNNEISRLIDKVYTKFDFNHTYQLPGIYNIKVTAIDNAEDTSFQVIPVVVDFKVTSLSGINEKMFKKSENEYLVLTVNLHTYQELQQNEKFHLLANVIGKMDIDFIAFQECAQNKSTAINTGIIRQDNMAFIISNILKEKYNADYNYIWNWAHYGWDVWEEGVAVLSKHTLINSEDRYISSSTSTGNITSRKAIFCSIWNRNCFITKAIFYT